MDSTRSLIRRPAAWVIATCATFTTAASADIDHALTFEQHVRPILKANCFHCHGEGEKLKGDLDLRLRRLIAKGGESGAAIVPANAAESRLFAFVRDGEMPPDDRTKLTEQEVESIRRWIDAGAPTAAPEPEDAGSGFLITKAERDFWAFQPVRRPAVPEIDADDRVRTPIDAFILRQLVAAGLGFSADTSRRTLLRRLTFDLTGLPPTPEQIATFVADTAPGNVERLVDRLLASPHYGERWARHWLDTAGYADSEGYTESDDVRKWAYKFRDYVIRSFNAGKRFDHFIQEQLAGDELIDGALAELSPADQERLEATGFLRMAADGTGGGGGVDQAAARNQVIADTIGIVSSSLLGLTVQCAQCHHHRYDPISQEDYYQLRAIFEPAYNPKDWKAPAGRKVSLYTDADRTRATEIEAEAVAIEKGRNELQEKYIAETLEKQLQKLAEELREPMRIARNTPEKDRSEEQKRLLAENPAVNVSAGSLYLYNQKAADELKALAEKAKSVRATKPVEGFIRALTEPRGAEPPVTYVFHRGDPEQPTTAVAPSGLNVLGELGTAELPANDPGQPTTGRRLGFARRLTTGQHPLVARVIVNRVWAGFFGKGLVATPGDLGQLGERPTHPLLLDWLAAEFVESGWDMKALQRTIVLSTVYRQSSERGPDAANRDPDNRHYGRMPMRRLEAEALRDAVIAVSGKLNPEMFGPPVPVREDDVGQIVIGIENKDGEGKPGKEIPLGAKKFRRSIYVQARRSRPLGVLEPFDLPQMEPNCSARSSSTVAPQALTLMNSRFVLEFSMHLAERVRREVGDGVPAQVSRAWLLAYGRPPDESELQDANTFLAEQTKKFQQRDGDKGENPQTLSLASLCQALVGSNEFLYVD